MNTDALTGYLYRLARLNNVQTSYYDVAHRRRQASVDSLLAVLRTLGAPVASLNDVPSAWRERRQALRQRMLEPVTVAWDGECPVISVCLPASAADAPLNGHLELESGERQTCNWCAADLPILDSGDIEGIRYVVKNITMPASLPWGYHRFILELRGNFAETLIISAPVKTYLPHGVPESRIWGTFIPLYSLRTRNSWGSGDLSSLEALADCVASLGGRVVSTLPLLPAFLDEPFAPSPYAPVSRLLWNEFYLDVTKVPELAECPPAQAILQSSSFRMKIKNQQDSSLVDYRQQMALKRRVLEELGRCLSAGTSGRFADFKRFIQANPIVADYARFRAVSEKQRLSWHSWPQPLRDGILKEEDYDEKARHYHMYAQWLAHQQIQALSEKSRDKGMMLYFDLPLGVHAGGYDVWRERSIFGLDASAGAPPDAVFTTGQNWAFPPLHPEKIREQGYRYVIAYIRHHLKHAGILRIDHVMGLHRLFWIPEGLEISQGVYVRYRADEFYAILALESHRHRSLIVGEDLGMVPSYVRPAMDKHGLHHTYAVHYELAANPAEAFGRIRRNSVASLNTHDMPPFAAFWQGLDITERLSLGLLDRQGAQTESRTRQSLKDALITFLQKKNLLRVDNADAQDILEACLAYLSASHARIALVNLEDLWLETQAQNVPSTNDEYPNWQNKARYKIEDFCHMPEVLDTLREVNNLRSPRRTRRMRR